MKTQTESLKFALEALECALSDHRPYIVQCKEAITAIKAALAQPAQQEPVAHCEGGPDVCPVCRAETRSLALEAAVGYIQRNTPPLVSTEICNALKKFPPAQQETFTKHGVDQPYDWSEWVCPDPKGYLMKCCDCGLVHEIEFGVVRYTSEIEREDCDMVDDSGLQAVFRMRRSR